MSSAKAGTIGPPAIFGFADLVLDVRQHAVFRNEVRLRLPKLTYELLLALVEAAPALLTYDELAERVWQGRLVTQETLAQRVLLLRRGLGDAADSPRYLRVVRGLGCQIIPHVDMRLQPSSLLLPSTAQGDDAGSGGSIDLSLPDQPSIVILPFDSDGTVEHRNFALGLSYDIMTRIARTRAFFVIARGSAFRFAPGMHDLRDVSRTLGVRYVVQGDARVSGSTMRVSVALADAVEGREIWADDFRGKPGDVFATQEEIAELVVGAISAEVELAERQRAWLDNPVSLDAWRAYHRGCWHMYRFTSRDYEQAERYFDLATKLDPGSSRALAGLSFVHWQRAFFELVPDRAGEIGRAFDLALRSYTINPNEPLAHWALGRAHLLRGEMDAAIVELGAATALNPSFAVGQYTLGFALMQAGDTEAAIRMANKALRLSPYDPMGFAMAGVRGFSLLLDGCHEEAVKTLEMAVRLPSAHYHLVALAAVCAALADHEQEARGNLARLDAAMPGYGEREFLRAFQFQLPAHRHMIGDAFRRLGRMRASPRT